MTKADKDKEFEALQLRASLCPSMETQWEPPNSYSHWQHLHETANELRNVVSLALQSLQAIEADKDLVAEAKARKKLKLGRQTLEQLEEPTSLNNARESVRLVQEKWQRKIDDHLIDVNRDDAATALLFREVRDKFASLEDERARMSYLERFGNDPQIATALLRGPAGLTNLSDAERTMLWTKVEAHVDPDIIKARKKLTQVMAEVERSYRAGRSIVGKAAGLVQTPGGQWVEPTAWNKVA
jgi:hypothetical protein